MKLTDKPIGKFGNNLHKDTAIIQRLPNNNISKPMPMKPTRADGIHGKNRLHFVREFKKYVVCLKISDLYVGPDGKTESKLIKSNTKNHSRTKELSRPSNFLANLTGNPVLSPALKSPLNTSIFLIEKPKANVSKKFPANPANHKISSEQTGDGNISPLRGNRKHLGIDFICSKIKKFFYVNNANKHKRYFKIKED